MHLTWLIQGHLTKENAINMVNIAESSLDYRRIRATDLDFSRLIKLNHRTIYSFERSNENAENPNSAYEARFAYSLDIDKAKWAAIRIVAAFLAEPIFNTLRT